MGTSGASAVRAVCRAYRAWALEHPGRYAATVRAPTPGDADDLAASTAATEVIFRVLAAYDLDGDDVVDATRALRASLHGFVALENAGGFGLRRSTTRLSSARSTVSSRRWRRVPSAGGRFRR